MDNFTNGSSGPVDAQNNSPSNRKGTGFTNLQQYLSANQNNGLDQYLGHQLQNEGQNFTTDVSNQQNQFQNDLQTEQQQYGQSQDEAQNLLKPYSQYAPRADYVPQAPSASPYVTNPTSNDPNAVPPQEPFTPPTQQQAQDFQNFIGSPGYQGPMGLQNPNNLLQEAQSLQDLGQQYRQSNPSAILGRYLGGNNQYTQGMQNFDSMLLGGAPNTRAGLASLNSYTPTYISNLNQGDQAQAQAQQSTEAGNLANLRKQLGLGAGNVPLSNTDSNPGIIQNMQNAVQNQVNQDIYNQQQALQNAQNAFSSPTNASQWNAILQPYGASGPISYSGPFQEDTSQTKDTGYYGINPNNYVSAGPQASFASVANPQQQAQINALQQLIGAPQTQFGANTAGTYDASHNGMDFNKDKFNTDLQQAVANYQNGINGQPGEKQLYQQLLSAVNAPLQGGLQFPQGGIPAIAQQRAQPYIDQINQLRAQYGLAPVKNTFNAINGTSTGGGNAAPAPAPQQTITL